jgi:pSer/pThr/pTyr-binding forkhead associated (FHA) protein
MDSFKDGINLVGKMAARGVTSISKQMKGEEREGLEYPVTGLFYQRHILTRFGDMIPRIQFCEPVCQNRLMGSFVKKLVRTAAEKSFVAAGYAMLFGDIPLAREKLRESIAADPQFVDGYFILGSLQMESGQFEAAEENFSKCRLLPSGLGERLSRLLPTLRLSLCITDNLSFVLMPDVLGLNLLLALSQRNGKNPARAIQTLEQLLSVMPGRQELLFFLALFYFEAGWDEKIVELLKELIPGDNLSVLIVQVLVKAWINRNNLSLAEGILQKAMETAEIEPHLMADLRMLLAHIARQTNRVAESSAYASRVKKQYPDYVDLEWRLGIRRSATVIEPPAPRGQKTGAAPSHPTVAAGPAPSAPAPSLAEGEEGSPGDVRLSSKDGKVSLILPDSLVIGREEGDLQIPWDGSASRVHARLYREKSQVWIEDMGSTNGSWINQHKVSSPRVFNRGDVLLIGQTEFFLE